jgi:predicted permease
LVRAFYEDLRTGLQGVPSSVSAGLVTDLGDTDALWIEGRPEPRPGEPRPFLQAVSTGFFRTLEIPILTGRPISDQDGKDTEPVIVLSESVVRHYWPDGNAVGARVRLHKTDLRPYRIVGVAGNRRDWFFGTPLPHSYVPFTQVPRTSAGIFVRTSGDPLSIAGAVRKEVGQLDRSQPIFDLKTEEQVVAEQTSGVRMSALTMTKYGCIALLLAITGIYAIISHSVHQRTLEIGIRMALGADRRNILRMTLSGAMRIGALGLGIGIPIAFALLQLMSSVLYGVVRPDALTFTGGVAALAVSAIAAGYVPSLRAARVDPVIALRDE